MSKPNDGGTAFPHEQIIYGRLGRPPGEPVYHQGMSLRDWFAGQTIANWHTSADCHYKDIAEAAYEIADAMIVERDK